MNNRSLGYNLGMIGIMPEATRNGLIGLANESAFALVSLAAAHGILSRMAGRSSRADGSAGVRGS